MAALWTLRNFAVVELYRSRISTMAVVMALCVAMLEDHHQPPAVHHAAAAVLQVCTGIKKILSFITVLHHVKYSVPQVATTADKQNVKQLSETNAINRLVACLYVKHRCVNFMHRLLHDCPTKSEFSISTLNVTVSHM